MAAPRRFLAYMAGRSTPFFLGVFQELMDQLGSGVEALYFLIGDLYHFRWAQKQQLASRLFLIYQHEDVDPFVRRPKLDYKRLAELENRYGLPNLWRYTLTQRMIERLSHDQKIAYVSTYLEYYESLYERLRPDVFIVGGQDSLPFIAANEVFKRNGCISLVLTPGWIPEYVFVIDNEFVQIPGLAETYNALKRRDLTPEERTLADRIRESYCIKRIRPAVFQVGHGVSVLPSPLRLVHSVWRRWWFNDRFFDVSLRENAWRSIVVRTRYPIQRLIVRRFAAARLAAPRAFYYPLAYEPEASLDVLGGLHLEQIAVIEDIAAALPGGYILYVKEHPNMFIGSRPLAFYRRLASIPNIKLLDRSIDGHDVIAACCGVITVAGSSGFEALFYGKPVLLLGRTFYEVFGEGVFRPNDLEDMATKLQYMAHFPGFDPQLLDRFVIAVLSRSYPGLSELPATGVDTASNYAALARALAKELDYRLQQKAQA